MNQPTTCETAASKPAHPVLLRSALLWRLGVPHAFTTRLGGVSTGDFASLNFGNPSDLAPERKDPRANIHANHRLTLDALGQPERRIVEVWQVHAAAVHFVRATEEPRSERARAPGDIDIKADAIVTDDPRVFAGVRVADCAPILLADADGAVVASVHAGWRGVIAGVLPAAIASIRSCTERPLFAAIGPCISAEAFEVGPEVAEAFAQRFGASVLHTNPGTGRRHVNLKLALALQLASAGVMPENIETLPHCTVRDRELFFSHRRDGERSGRMLALIGPRSA